MLVTEIDGEWFIVKNKYFKETGGITGTRSRTGNFRWIHDGFWTGENWSAQRTFGMTFETQEAADQYLDENQHRIQQD